jgi:tetratricopeptide (TPR) repeat protein
LGVVEWYRENHPQALDYYSRALSIHTEIGDREGEGRTLNNIGLVYNMQGEYTTALDYYTRSLQIARELGDRWGEARTPNNIGTVYALIGEYEKALEYYTQALATRQQLGDRSGECITLGNIGSAHELLGTYTKALDYYGQALKISEELGDPVSQGQLRVSLGIVYHKMGQYPKALKLLADGHDLLVTNGERSILISLSWLALTEVVSGDKVSGRAYMMEAEKLLESSPRTEEFVDVCWNLYQANTLLGNRSKALLVLEQAHGEVVARAERISDKDMRNSYLTNVRTSKEVLMAWKTEARITMEGQ